MMRTARISRLLAPFACALLLALPALAAAQALGQVAVDFVRASGDGTHRLLVSAFDPNGQPIGDLDHAFRVTFDGQPVDRLLARPTSGAYHGATVTVVIDGALLQKDALPAVQDALTTLARGLDAGDDLRVVAAGRKVRARSSNKSGAPALIKDIGSLGDAETPLLYDALHDAAREAAHLSDDRESVVLLVTRGGDGGSDHTLLEVFALARTRTRLTPVMVTIVGDEGTAAEADRLQRLAAHTAGAYGRVTSPVDLGSQLAAQLVRGRDRWVLDFKVPDYRAGEARHRIALELATGGEQRTAELEYATAEVLPRPWWTGAGLWIALAALAVLGALAWFLTRRRQRCLFVHDGDEDDGVWYEVFGLPATLGGASGNDIVFADSHVSRNHAVLEGRGRVIELVDLNSENGTFVNGERISRRVLADGDRVDLGPDVHLLYEARG